MHAPCSNGGVPATVGSRSRCFAAASATIRSTGAPVVVAGPGGLNGGAVDEEPERSDARLGHPVEVVRAEAATGGDAVELRQGRWAREPEPLPHPARSPAKTARRRAQASGLDCRPAPAPAMPARRVAKRWTARFTRAPERVPRSRARSRSPTSPSPSARAATRPRPSPGARSSSGRSSQRASPFAPGRVPRCPGSPPGLSRASARSPSCRSFRWRGPTTPGGRSPPRCSRPPTRACSWPSSWCSPRSGRAPGCSASPPVQSPSRCWPSPPAFSPASSAGGRRPWSRSGRPGG